MDFQVDALYFQAQEGGVPYSVIEERVIYPDFKSRFGIRGVLGIDLGHDCWQLKIKGLHFHARSTDDVAGKEFFPTWVHPATSNEGYASSVRSRWRLHLGFLDALLSRVWEVSPCLELEPSYGLRGAGVRHKLRVIYRDGTLIPNGEDNISMKNKFWGIGPEFGVGSLWKLRSWAGVYARGAFSLLFGSFYIHQDEDGEQVFKFFDDFYSIQNVFEMGIGLRCSYSCFSAEIGWEQFLLPNQNQLVQFVDGTMAGKYVGNLGSLSFGGLSFGLKVSY